MNGFPERLKQLRLENNLTQEKLGDLLGVKKYSIYTYEKNRSEPDIDGLIILADYFGVSIDYLVGRSDNRNENYVQKET